MTVVVDEEPRSGFLMTWNPARWTETDWIEEGARRSHQGKRPDADRWSSGGRRSGYEKGDRVFLLKQGAEPRGIVGSGWVHDESGTYPDRHWDGSGRLTTYLTIDWEYFVNPSDPLPIGILQQMAPNTHWRPQSSGVKVASEDLDVIEELWAAHTSSAKPGDGKGRRPQKPRTAGWQADPELRRLAEDHAQAMLEDHYRDEGWTVTDTRFGNPYDARALRAGEVLYLEAKGTTSLGDRVQVTAGEVRFAREHPGQCIIGVVRGIEFNGRKLDADSGTLSVYPWDPDAESLEPIRYRWTPPTTGLS